MAYFIGLTALAFLQATERPPAEPAPTMTAAGWAFLIISWAAITFVTIWTFAKILRPNK